MQTDPDDLIFPRNPTRIGPKYQTVCPPCCNADSTQECKSSSCPDAWVWSHYIVSDIEEPGHDMAFQRGGDLTIEIISSLCNLSEEDGAPSLNTHVFHARLLQGLLIAQRGMAIQSKS